MDIIKVNSRMPDVLEGDVWAAIASVRIGARRLRRARREIRGRDVRERHVVVHGFRRAGVARRELAKLPKGVFELSEEQDDGRIFNVKITISDTEFVVDLLDNPDQAANPVNTSRDGVMVCAQMIFKSLTDP